MDNAQHFTRAKDMIGAFSIDKIRTDRMPFLYFLKIAEIQAERGRQNLARLVQSKMKPDILEPVPMLLGALRHTMTAWTDVQFDTPESAKQWKEKQALAEIYRFEIESAITVAFPNDESLKEKLVVSHQGGSNEDDIQDINDLVHYARQNMDELLAKSELTQEMVDSAAVLAAELGQLHAKATVDRSNSPEAHRDRDILYTMIANIMEEVERYGHYAFRNDEKKANQFTFQYKSITRKPKMAKPVLA